MFCFKPLETEPEDLQLSLCKDKNGTKVYTAQDTVWIGDTVHAQFKANRYNYINSLHFSIEKEKSIFLFKRYFRGPFKASVFGSYDSMLVFDTSRTEEIYTFTMNAHTYDSLYAVYLLSLPVCGKNPCIQNKTILSVEDEPAFSKYFRMYVKTTGSPGIRYFWYKTAINNRPVATTDTLKKLLTFADTGIYYCVAINKYGRDTTQKYTIQRLKFPPELLNKDLIAIPSPPELGKQLSLETKIKRGDTPFTFIWIKNNTIVDSTGFGNPYIIDSLTIDHLGMYQCVVKNKYGIDSSRITPLYIDGKPMLVPKTVYREPEKVYKGFSMRLWIRAFCTSPFKYQWYKNNIPMQGNATFDTLKIDTVQTKDAGVYTCIVFNNFGADTSLKCTVTVLSPDPATIAPPKNILHIGTPFLETEFKMLVQATGADPLKYQWYRDDSLISTSYTDTLTLMIEKQSAGTYRCKVSNFFGADSSKPYTLVPVIPRIVIDNNGNLIPSGEAVIDSPYVLQIKIKEGIVTHYQWFKNDTVLEKDTLPSLSFTRLVWQDGGIYKCKVAGKYDTTAGNPFTLVVDSLPGRARILAFTMTGQAIVDSACSLTVKAYGKPAPQYKWFKNDTLLPATGAALSFSRLKTTDAGTYTCIAYNEKGADTTKPPYQLQPIVLNQKPALFVVKGINDTVKVPDPTFEVKEKRNLAFDVCARDINGADAILIAKFNAPDGALLERQGSATNPVRYRFTYTPSYTVAIHADQVKLFSAVTFIADDQHGLRDTFRVNIKVPDSNSVPRGDSIIAYVNAAEPTLIEGSASDEDGDPLTWSLQPNSFLFGTANPTGGSVAAGNRFSFTYTPKASTTSAFMDTCTVWISDAGVNPSKPNTVALRCIITVNTAPKVKMPSFILDEGRDTTLTLAHYVEDEAVNDVQWSAMGTTKYFSVTITNNKTAKIIAPTPTEFMGKDTIKVIAKDSRGLSDTGAAIITVNRKPKITPIPDTTFKQGDTLRIKLDDYVHDPDDRDDKLKWSAHIGLSRPEIVITKSRIAVISSKDWTGKESIVFTVSDPRDLKAVDTVTVTVTQNSIPRRIKRIPDQTIDSSGTFEMVDLTDYFKDDDDGNSELQWVAVSSSNKVSVNITNYKADFTRNDPGWADTCTVFFKVSDKTGAARDTMLVKVKSTMYITLPNKTVSHAGTFDIIQLDTCVIAKKQPDKSKIVWDYTPKTIPHFTIALNAGTHALTITHDHSEEKLQATITLTAKDATNDLTATKEVIFTVEANKPPEALQWGNISIKTGDSVTVPFTAIARDPEGEPLTETVEGTSQFFDVIPGGTGFIIKPKPTCPPNQQDTITIKAVDPHNEYVLSKGVFTCIEAP